MAESARIVGIGAHLHTVLHTVEAPAGVHLRVKTSATGTCKMAPEVGFEPTTIRLTVGRSTTELLRNLECEGRTTCLRRPPEATDFVRIFAVYFGDLTDRGVVLSLPVP